MTLPLMAALVASSASAWVVSKPTSLLPEVTKHMEQARENLQSGYLDVAAAHVEVVLVGDEVTYNLKCEGLNESRQALCEQAFLYAANTWETALGGSVHFRRVDDPATAQVSVRFMPNVTMKGEAVAGYVNWKRTIRMDHSHVAEASFKADLQLRACTLNGGRMPIAAMKHEAMHELGHVLGLDDSDREGDIMGPLDVDHPCAKPLPREVEAVRELRDEAQHIRAEALVSKAKL